MFLNIVIHRPFIKESGSLWKLCAKLRKVSQGFRKPSKTFLTASSTCKVPLGARTEVKDIEASKDDSLGRRNVMGP